MKLRIGWAAFIVIAAFVFALTTMTGGSSFADTQLPPGTYSLYEKDHNGEWVKTGDIVARNLSLTIYRPNNEKSYGWVEANGRYQDGDTGEYQWVAFAETAPGIYSVTFGQEGGMPTWHPEAKIEG